MAASVPPPSPPRPWQRFLAGTVSGFALVAVGHPFDTLRVKLQTGADRSLVRLVVRLFASEGVRGFYRGFVPPFLFTGLINTSLWGVQYSLMDAMEQRGIGDSAATRALLCAIPASAVSSLITAPIEGIKTRQQTRPGAREPAIAVLRDVLRKDGLFGGLYRGFTAVILTRCAGGTVYFSANAAALDALGNIWPAGNSSIAKTRNTLIAGGCAGMCYWIPAMPFDTIKSRLMAAPDGERRYAGVTDCARKLYYEAGMRGFYRGFSAALVRAFPANAAAFTAADITMRAINPSRAS